MFNENYYHSFKNIDNLLKKKEYNEDNKNVKILNEKLSLKKNNFYNYMKK